MHQLLLYRRLQISHCAISKWQRYYLLCLYSMTFFFSCRSGFLAPCRCLPPSAALIKVTGVIKKSTEIMAAIGEWVPRIQHIHSAHTTHKRRACNAYTPRIQCVHTAHTMHTCRACVRRIDSAHNGCMQAAHTSGTYNTALLRIAYMLRACMTCTPGKERVNVTRRDACMPTYNQGVYNWKQGCKPNFRRAVSWLYWL